MARFGTVADAAAEWGVSPTTVRRFIAAGDVVAERPGHRAWRVDLDSFAPKPAALSPRGALLRAGLQSFDKQDMLALARAADHLRAAVGSRVAFHEVWGVVGAAALSISATEVMEARL